MSRYLLLTKNMIEFLQHKREIARKILRGRDEDSVFVNSLGNVVESDVLDRIVRDACKELGYIGLVPYGLRHTAFSDMVACDVSIEKIRRLAGHSKLTTTQKYLKTNVRHLHEALATASSGQLVRKGTNGHKTHSPPPPVVPIAGQ